MIENRTADGVLIKAGMELWNAHGTRFTVVSSGVEGEHHAAHVKRNNSKRVGIIYGVRSLYASRLAALTAEWNDWLTKIKVADKQIAVLREGEMAARRKFQKEAARVRRQAGKAVATAEKSWQEGQNP
jgi:hypothetical protein